MILLDTNVISEIMMPDGNPRVRDWLDSGSREHAWLCAPVLEELRFGALYVAHGKKRDFLLAACDRLEHEIFNGRVLPFDAAAARRSAEVRVFRRSHGRGISIPDAMIAAIAHVHGMMLATRNVRDFDGLEIPVVDPFSA
jgi:toxin FitB